MSLAAIDQLRQRVFGDDYPLSLVGGQPTHLLASAFPIKPPPDWFSNPRLERASPLSVTADGRVMGHIATWNTSHIGLPGGTKPPRSRSNYAFFATGVVECADGKMVDVGQLTSVGGHAPLEASVSQAVAHYDNTKSAFADVAIGEDRHGIWVSGAVRPSVTDEQIRIVRASAISGDWRPINGALELVAACSVNVPGFPIPRARVASGQVLALVAAGVEPLVEARQAQLAAAEVVEVAQAFDERLVRLEDALVAAGDEPDSQIIELRQRVHGGPPSEEDVEARIVELRRRVKGESAETELGELDTVPDETPAEGGGEVLSMAAALRARVHADPDPVTASITATATSSWDTKSRKKAASSGAAMADGSYPIADCTDVGKAVHAIGRGNKDPGAIKAHIKKRAKALGCMDSLPDDWK